MVRSMTGYGRGECGDETQRVVVEVRAVNHRYLDVSLRMPRVLLPLEQEMKKLVAAAVSRGRVEMSVQLEGAAGSQQQLQVDREQAARVCQLVDDLRQDLNLAGQVDVQALLAFREMLFQPGSIRADVQALWDTVRPALESALAALQTMQCTEGREIGRDMLQRIAAIGQSRAAVEGRAPEALAIRQQALRERVQALCSGAVPDEERMLQEIALMADKSDITEELVRAGSHLQQLTGLLEGSGPVGRKFDFLLQELNREVNTIGSKACDVAIAHLVVEMKNELEKIREQVQNIM